MPKNEPVFSFMWEGIAVGVNRRYADMRSKRLNPEYAAFKANIAWACRTSNHGLVNNPIASKLFVRYAQFISASRDWDSLAKPLCDGIEDSGVIANDNKIRNVSVITIDKKRGQFDRITVKAYLLEDGE